MMAGARADGEAEEAGGRQRVFVYGTLREGGSNAWRMAGAAKVGVAAVRGRLYRVSWYPALLLDRAGGEVAGEVWEVGAELLAELDRFEGVAPGGGGGEYRRVRAVARLAGGGESPVWLWEWAAPVAGLELLAGGDWLAAQITSR
jgi:gamma-glutamylcyclotransferase (GGCT)/AIG2-like uncharacterized protein YtfP